MRSVSRPPTAGPATAEIPHTAPKRPWMRARVSSSKMSPMLVMATAGRAPAPTARAGRRARDRGDPPPRPEETLDARPSLQLEDVPDDSDGYRLDRPGPEALHRPERYKRRHALGGPGEHAPQQEQEDAGEVDGLSTVGVGELAEDGPGNCRRQEVRGEGPGVEREPAELADDRWHRGADHRGVERGQERPDQRRKHHERLASPAHTQR